MVSLAVADIHSPTEFAESESNVLNSALAVLGTGRRFGATLAEPLSAAVPEPATVVLILIGGAVANRRWHRARFKNSFTSETRRQTTLLTAHNSQKLMPLMALHRRVKN